MPALDVTIPLTPPPRHAGAVDVVACGENSLDYAGVVGPGGSADKRPLTRFDQRPGGQAATAAVACARQGLRARYVGVFGDDAAGKSGRAALAQEALDVVAIERVGVPSRIAMVLVDPGSGARVVYEFRDPALSLVPEELPLDALTEGRLLLLDASNLAAAVVAARHARSRGVPTILDIDRVAPGAAELLSAVAVVVVPELFLAEFTGVEAVGAALRQFAAEYQPAATIVTLGADGSLAWIGGQEIRTPGYVVDVADTTGAGDAFRGGLATAWLRLGSSASAARLLAHANASAALNCRGFGAQTGLPTWTDVETLVTATPYGQSN